MLPVLRIGAAELLRYSGRFVAPSVLSEFRGLLRENDQPIQLARHRPPNSVAAVLLGIVGAVKTLGGTNMSRAVRSASAAIIAAFALSSFAGGVAQADAPAAHEGGSAIAPKETTAPKCIHDKEKKGTVYTTVWATNKCKRNYRIQLIMARGADSRCFSIAPGQTRSHESRGASPYLDRIVLC